MIYPNAWPFYLLGAFTVSEKLIGRDRFESLDKSGRSADLNVRICCRSQAGVKTRIVFRIHHVREPTDKAALEANAGGNKTAVASISAPAQLAGTQCDREHLELHT